MLVLWRAALPSGLPTRTVRPAPDASLVGMEATSLPRPEHADLELVVFERRRKGKGGKGGKGLSALDPAQFPPLGAMEWDGGGQWGGYLAAVASPELSLREAQPAPRTRPAFPSSNS